MSLFKIVLINMPFAGVHLPSLALTQLKALLSQELGDRASCAIKYLNHDCAGYLGLQAYHSLASSPKAAASGLGDWFFRQAAFPETQDNTAAYASRFFWQFAKEAELCRTLTEKRPGIGSFLDELIERHDLASYALVGFTSMFSQNTASFAMARKLKQRNPGIVTVMGGANCEGSMGEVIARKVAAIDYVFSGSALVTFPALVAALLAGEGEEADSLPGVWSKAKVARQPPGQASELGAELDINTAIGLDYDDFLLSLQEHCPGETYRAGLLFETSRGCWWGERSQCRFCGLNGSTMRYRFMEPRQAIRQFERLFRYAPRVSRFKAVDNIAPKPYFTEVFPFLQPPANATVFYEVKTVLDDRDLQVLANAGIREIQPGIESLATSTLKLMRKGATAFQNITFLKGCLTHAIQPDWNLLVGFPGEAEAVFAQYDRVLPQLFHLPPPMGVFPVRFDRFSPYFQEAAAFGLNLKPYDFYRLVYPFGEEDLAGLAYFFLDQNVNAPHMQLTAKWLRKLEAHVERWRGLWHHTGSMQEKPLLSFAWQGEERVILDSRSGAVVKHRPGEMELRLLDALTTVTPLTRLAEKIGSPPSAAFEQSLLQLREKGLLFQEEGCCVSLIVDSSFEIGSL